MLLPLSICVVLKVLAIKNKAKKYKRGNLFVIEGEENQQNTVVCRWHGCLCRNCKRCTEKLLTPKMSVNGLIRLMALVTETPNIID